MSSNDKFPAAAMFYGTGDSDTGTTAFFKCLIFLIFFGVEIWFSLHAMIFSIDGTDCGKTVLPLGYVDGLDTVKKNGG